MANIGNIDFREITRAQAKASIVIQGLAGSGKSGLAIMIANTLANAPNKVFANDTENRSLDLFQGITSHLGQSMPKIMKYDLLPTRGYAPSNYLAVMQSAKSHGAEVVINDSLSHAWAGKGGVLQMVAELERNNSKVNKFNAWGQPIIIAERDAIFELLRDSEVHIINTVRQKEKFEQTADGKVNSVGEQQIMMPDVKYEPDLVLEMISAGNSEGVDPVAKVLKSRYTIFAKDCVYKFDQTTLNALRDYLLEGIDPQIMLEQQRQDYITEIKAILDSSESKRVVWSVIKAEFGLAEVNLSDMSLAVLRKLIARL